MTGPPPRPFALVLLVVVLAAPAACVAACGGNPNTPSGTPGGQPPPSGPVKVSACGTVLQPGAYAVIADLGDATTANCLTVVTAGQVSLDCQGHSVAGLTLQNVNSATITNCGVLSSKVLSVAAATQVTIDCQGLSVGAVSFLNVSGATVSNCTVPSGTSSNYFYASGAGNLTLDHDALIGGVRLNAVSQATISNSHVSGYGIGLTGVTGAAITGNTFDALNATGAFEAVFAQGGMNNRITQNTVDGGWHGTCTASQTGALSCTSEEMAMDDGVLLIDEQNDVVQGNTISNVYDAGVEGVDLVSGTTIDANTVTNAGFTGIGSYWCTRWEGNTVSNNHVASSFELAYFDYGVDNTKCAAPATVGGFANNQIVSNQFRTPTWSNNSMGVFLASVAASEVSGNVIRGNDFGLQTPGPYVTPAAGFTNDGSNICPSTGLVGNLICGSGGGFRNFGVPPIPQHLTPPRVSRQRVNPLRSSPTRR